MRILKIALGNKHEAYIEDRLKNGFNIIYSDDNNKGKTIVIQSSLYAIGNVPIFPSSFDYKDYYHYVEIEIDNRKYSICRKDNSFVIANNKSINLFESISELKRYLIKNGLNIPTIIKDGKEKIVDPELLFQIFFVGQDKKNTSSIFNDSYYKKDDFWSLIYSLKGLTAIKSDDINIEKIKSKIRSLEDEVKVLKEKDKVLKKKSDATRLIFKKNDKDALSAKIREIDKTKEKIIEISKDRNRAISKKVLNEKTLREIRSLNRNVETGKLYCANCGSERIIYSSKDKSYEFDITNAIMRKNIIQSIEENIEAYQEEIEQLSIKINELQSKLQKELSDDDISLETLLLYKDDILNNSDYDSRIIELENEIQSLKTVLTYEKKSSTADREKKEKLKNSIIKEMNDFYKDIDPNGNLVFDDIFSKRNAVYSGCEGTEFYLSKLYALVKILKHDYPIIMDYFRDGELSSDKEDILIEKFSKLSNQIIFTATLKNEELGKYSKIKFINDIDYSNNEPSHILSEDNVEEFKNLLSKLQIKLR